MFFVNHYRNRRDLRVLTEHMVHMEHMAVVSDSQLRLAEQPLNLNWAIHSSLSPN